MQEQPATSFYQYPFASHFLDVPGGRIHYLDEGSGPPIVMLHGNPTWSYYFRHLVTPLSATSRVIVPDHLGCGLSDKPQGYSYTLSNHIDNASRLLEHLDISSFSLVLHDWGGAIGMGLAAMRLNQVQRIAILNTAAFRSKRIPFRIRICRWPLLGSLLVRGLNGFARAALVMAVTKPVDKRVAGAYLAPYDCWKNRVALHAFVKDIPLAPNHPSYGVLEGIERNLEQVRSKQIPMLIIWGGRDFCFDDYFFSQWRRRFPDAQYHYLEGAGHYVLEDGHGTVEPLITAFLQAG